MPFPQIAAPNSNSNTPNGNTVVTSGTATSPGAGASFITPGTPAAGVYSVTLDYTITGTAESQPVNVRISANGGSTSINLPSSPGNYVVTIPRLTLNGSNQVFVLAIAAATAGAVYSGSFILTPLSS